MIRTYELSPRSKTPLYAQLYEAIRADILSGLLPGGEKLPSKRALAEHLSLSKITVETAYAQLLDEGYLTSRERSGYFVAHMPLLAQPPVRPARLPEKAQEPEIAQSAAAELFPFSVWAKLMRSVILDEGQYLLQPVPNGGLSPLRQAIAGELARQRGLVVQPEQIVIGAGTEYFYALLVQFLGRSRRFAIEDPCHRTLRSTGKAARRLCRCRWTKAACAWKNWKQAARRSSTSRRRISTRRERSCRSRGGRSFSRGWSAQMAGS